MTSNITGWCRLSLLLTACLISLQSQASDDALHDANDVRVLLDRVNVDYQMFKGENANPKYGEALEDDLEALEDARAEFLESAAADGLSAEANEIDATIDHCLDILKESYETISNGGFEAAVSAGDMIESKIAAQKALSAMHANMADASEMDPRVLKYQEMSYEMQQIAAKYLENAAATYGVAYRDQSDEKTIDQLAQEFAAHLASIDSKAADLPAGVQVQLADVTRKWGFIEQSLLNYMENQVSFLVYLYSRKIVDGLLNASEQLAMAQRDGDTAQSAPRIAPPEATTEVEAAPPAPDSDVTIDESSGIQLPPGIPAAQ